MTADKIYEAAIEKWGQLAQLEMAQEEATELALAVRKHIRKNNSETQKQLASEVADVEIMIEQLKFMMPHLQGIVDQEKQFKLERLAHRIQNETFE